MASRLGKHLIITQSEAENFGLFALYPYFLFICFLAALWLTFGYYWGSSLTHLTLTIALGISIFGAKVTRRDWGSTRN